ncbi:MAG: glycosyltransferase family 2 protein [Methanoregula sp.]|jgi:cellulose synthase/poly-beta-1,6-N-acetylglucosamine synthase-like glycosyltransferase
MKPFSKDRVLSLLLKEDLDSIAILEADEVTLDNIIFSLQKYKFDVDDHFFLTLADELDLPYLGPEQLREQSYRAPGLPYGIIRDQLIFLLNITPESVEIATANPFNRRLIQRLEIMFKRKVSLHIASIRAIEAANNSGYREIHKYRALKGLFDRNPDESAYRVLYPWQRNTLLILFFLVYGLFLVDGAFALVLVFSAMNIFYAIFNPVKFYISLRGFSGSQNEFAVSDDEIAALDESTLPVYTLFIPLYKEARILPNILKNINKLDYPKDKLDVKILLEEVDTETIAEAERLGLFGNPRAIIDPMTMEEYRKFLRIFDPVLIPDSDIRTKPRACNQGLYRAKGEFCVIFDAEDDPDPDQLKRAVILYNRIGDDYACIQARLNYYNPHDNILTHWFTIEYSYWFDYYLQGLDYVGCPIPLGGTSNHFRTKQLIMIGGWDPYNVTEDADLGIRIARRKLKVGMMESYTYEEANGHVWNWIRQRSRWNKGYIQTYFVHMRKPKKMLEDLGWKQFLLFQISFGGNVLLPLLNPLLWLITLLTLTLPELLHFRVWILIAVLSITNLFISNWVYVGLHLDACIKEKDYREIPYVLLFPFYWVLISIGAWKGLLQLLTDPFYWEKTIHGISKGFRTAATVPHGAQPGVVQEQKPG